ncbi:hypothetical protein, partial [Haloferax mucosum]|uniref:hypothetical protein n=1 Tax=Haloferax mucosum TaxID=403181 RepID=UPI00137633CC
GRRSVVKKTGAAIAGLGLCATGSAAASKSDTESASTDLDVGLFDSKNHYVKFEIESGDGSPDYEVNIPDPDPRLVSIENKWTDAPSNDKVISHDTWTKIKGGLDGADKPYKDEIEFHAKEDLDKEKNWEIVSADAEIRVILDGEVIQQG